MEEWEIDETIEGIRVLTVDERQYLIDQHCFMAEFVKSEDPDKLTDQELAREVKAASQEFVKNTF